MHFELPDFGKDLMSNGDVEEIENREKFKISLSACWVLPVAFFPFKITQI